MTLKAHRPVLRMLMALAFGYGLACFVAIFVLAFAMGGFDDPDMTWLRGAFVVAGVAGVLNLLRVLRCSGGRAVLSIDPSRKTLSLQSPKRDEHLRFSRIAHWRLRQVTLGADLVVNGKAKESWLLEVVCEEGSTIPIRVFSPGRSVRMEVKSIAAGARDLLADLTDSIVGKTITDKPPTLSKRDHADIA